MLFFSLATILNTSKSNKWDSQSGASSCDSDKMITIQLSALIPEQMAENLQMIAPN